MEFENIKKFDPSVCISNKVLRISRLTGNVFRKHLQPFNVTSSQVSILFTLSKTDGLTQKQLSEMLKLEKSSLNRNLKRLYDQQYLSKDSFPIIVITHDGQVLVNKIIPAWEKAMSEIRESLGQEGENAINLVLGKLC